MKTIAVLTSGGDAPGMNAAIRAVVRTAAQLGMKVYGVEQGYEGLMKGYFREMDRDSVSDILQRGGTILRTARSPEFMTEAGMQKAILMLNTFRVDGLVVIGGNGTLAGGLDLTKRGIRVMGLPATIDNDLGYTDFTIGFDTAVNTVIEAIGKIRDTSESHGRQTVIEVMGRKCGDIALYAGIASGAEYILLPDETVDAAAISRQLLQSKARGKHHNLIVRAEGATLSTEEIVRILEERTGEECKAVVLGYIQRGGSPTADDRLLASRTAYHAVKLLAEEGGSRAVGISGNRIIDLDLEEALAMKAKSDAELLEMAEILAK